MRKSVVSLLFLVLTAIFFGSAALSSTLPPPPSVKRSVRPDSEERQKAFDLYMFARKENRRLVWDRCLAGKAFLRAKELVTHGYFDHEDPATHTNPVWDRLLEGCYGNAVWAGENLVQGVDAAENVHKAFMNSPTHRENILNPRFSRIGVGCYDYVCVELFVGF